MSLWLQAIGILLGIATLSIVLLPPEKKYALRIWLRLSRKPKLSPFVQRYKKPDGTIAYGIYLINEDLSPPYPVKLEMWEPDSWSFTPRQLIGMSRDKILGQRHSLFRLESTETWSDLGGIEVDINWKKAPETASFVLTLSCADVTIYGPERITVEPW